jgi:endonuclease YncB( thermonuclease family)
VFTTRAALLLMMVLASCGAGETSRYSRKQAQRSLHKLENPGVVIGEFALTRVIDGDTIGVDGLDSSLRLIGLDCEETFKNESDRRAVEANWDAYIRSERGNSLRPVKSATPMGEQAKTFAKRFFDGVTTVRLERDDPRLIRDLYNRYLAVALVNRDGTWLNYNVEVVRAGMSPYFSKYGYSRRFHAEFLQAEREAKAARRGIWAPDAMAYRDYDERKAWWDARAEFIAQFDRAATGKNNHFVVSQWDILQRLEEFKGREVTLLGTVGSIRLGDRGPTLVMLSRRMYQDVPLVFFDKDVFVATGVEVWKGEWVAVTGVVTEYENKHNHRKQLQIMITRPDQLRLSTVPGLTPPSSH